MDKLCDAFEAAWKAGQQPQIAEYLDQVPADDRSTLLRELLANELELIAKSGGKISEESYYRRFSDHALVVMKPAAVNEELRIGHHAVRSREVTIAKLLPLRAFHAKVRAEGPSWPEWEWPRYESQKIEWPAYRRRKR
ncbi:MAG: hypothetical protein O3A00_08005 [Planctomycetota bacterium]|nr:hypothetical protein [Planctomycetota bacterium]